MSENERTEMINIINNKKPHDKLETTFFSLNGRNPSQQEINVFEENNTFEQDNVSNLVQL